MTTAVQDLMEETVRTVSHAFDDARDMVKLPHIAHRSQQRRSLRWVVILVLVSVSIALYSARQKRHSQVNQRAADHFRAA